MANASSVETPTMGFAMARAIPLAVLAPILTPVNEPGPTVQASRSMSEMRIPVRPRSLSSAGNSTSAWCFPVQRSISATRVSPSNKATATVFDAQSIPSVIIFIP